MSRDDRLTGLRHIDLFHEFFRRDFAIAQREGRPLALFVFDIDALGVYNDTFGRLAGDTVIRRVGRALLTGLRRASDLVSRVEGGRFIGLAAGLDAERAGAHAAGLATRVRELHLHHPRSPIGKVVTVSTGYTQSTPGPDETPETMLRDALRSLDTTRAARSQAAAGAEGPAADAG
jgi:hemerythrin